ncbi:hypothetical protein [Arenibaculum pallidiluteum]|uniref:hypothetical protein n=1 Tax=Arenibaculum pallidiluteum TaxID=2812559 RepID=UPI001A95E00F|nr:hypothetical protein [Arenibaculum pallidiluteum]
MNPGTPSPAGSVRHRGLITVAIMLATIMQVLDTTIANVALPSMQGSLGAALVPLSQSVLLDITPQALAQLDAMVTQQAAMIAYLDDFKLMMSITLAALPLLVLLRRPARPSAPGGGHAVME